MSETDVRTPDLAELDATGTHPEVDPPPDRTDVPPGLFHTLLESSTLCIAWSDLTLRVLGVSHEFSQVVRRPPGQVRGHDIAALVEPGFAVDIRRRAEHLADGSATRFTEDVLIRRADGALVPGHLTGTALCGADDQPRMLVVVFTPERGERPGGRGEPRLSRAGSRVLEAVAAGQSTAWMSAHLYLSRQGVDYHVRTLMRKLDVPNRPALVSKAYSLGMLRPGAWPPRVAPEWVR
ncbi:helix-turn-helix transcriptional regulator [Actinoalloteichus caeruleus]|uniref:helix-turn-helix transcriptional regulator n=1 Tax=Actinoalloteichus cyanogriseus TaxID=2893586 RepID=UPI0009DF663C|nr:helix-turn-helix transcriptional regulator [Actinoalloteichus caeruleus]